MVAANNKLLLDVPISELKAFVSDMLDYFEAKHGNIVDQIENEKVLTDELTQQIIDAIKEFKK